MSERIIYFGNAQSDFSASFLKELKNQNANPVLVVSSTKRVFAKKNLPAKLLYIIRSYTYDELLLHLKIIICEYMGFSKIICCRKTLERYSLGPLCEEFGYEYFVCNSINDRKIIKKIKSFKPDVILIHSFGEIVKKDVLEIPKIGTYNFHPGALPTNQGASPVEWTVLNKNDKVTTCCHIVTERVDTGNIIFSKSLRLKGSKSWKDIKKKSKVATKYALAHFLSRLTQGNLSSIPQTKEKMKYNPRLSAIQKYRVRLLSRIIYR